MMPATASRDRRCLYVVPLAALVAVMPLVLRGCSCGHDFDFHLLNWMEAARQFSHGTLHPQWAFSPAFNAGEPRFVFYPPLSWYLGAALGLLLTHLPAVTEAQGWTAAPIAFTWIALTASGFAMVRLAHAFAGANAALLAAVLYLANPYMLFTAYERTAYGELLAAAWIPLLLLAILREKITVSGIALPVALLWLSNIPAAIIGTYALALLAAIRIATSLGGGWREHPASEMREIRRGPSLQLALKTIAGFALGLALAAFYIVPAAYERRYVQIAMATIADMRIDRNFLFLHTGTSPDDVLHDQVLHAASLIAVLQLALSTAALVLVFLQRKRRALAPTSPTLPLAILTATVAFLLTPISAAIWNHAPEAEFVQFPWRLLLVVAPIFALTLPAASSRWVGRKTFAVQPLIAILLATVLTLPAYRLFRQPCDPADTVPARLALFESNAGTDPTDEYTPVTADNDALKPNDPPYWLADSPAASAPATALRGPAPMHLSVTSPRAQALILNLRDYPAWQITLNGALASHSVQRPDGLIAIAIPAGSSTLDIGYAQSFDHTLGDAITLFAFPLFLFTCRLRRQASDVS